jgi:RNA polymerase sigma factor (sigma-70 family)
MGERRRKPMDPIDSDGSIEEHLDTIFSVARATARSLGGNDYEADEVAQLTAYKLWCRRADPRVVDLLTIGGARWRGYIRQTARNTHIDLIRQHQRRLARQQRAEEGRTGRPFVEGDAALVPVPVGDVEEWIARQVIADEIELLPTQQRRVARRIFLLELSVAEVAEELQLQQQTVRKHARAARQWLRNRLSEAEPQPL